MASPDDKHSRAESPSGRERRLTRRDLDAAARGGEPRSSPRFAPIAETRGEDSEVVELVELPPTSGRARRPSRSVAADAERARGAPAPTAAGRGRALSVDELRDAWPLLDLDERSDGLRVLPREDAEDFFVALPAARSGALLLHFRPGQRRQWMRLLEPDDVADVIQEAGDEHKQTLLALLDAPTRKEVTALLAYAEDEAGGLMSTRYARLRPQMTADEAMQLPAPAGARRSSRRSTYAYVLDHRAAPARRRVVPRSVRRRARRRSSPRSWRPTSSASPTRWIRRRCRACSPSTTSTSSPSSTPTAG